MALKRLGALIDGKNFSGAEIGRLIGVSKKSISDWKLGESEPSVEQQKALAKVLGVSVSELIGDDEANESSVKHEKTTKIKVKDDPIGKIAKQIQRDHDTREAKQLAGLEDERLTIKQALARHLVTLRQTSERYRQDCTARADRLTEFFEKIGVTLLEQIEPNHIDKLIESRQRDGAANKTIKNAIDQLRSAVKLANRRRLVAQVSVDAWPRITKTTSARPDRVGAYTLDEVTRLIDYMGKRPQRAHWQIPIKLLAYLGCRWGELSNMKVGDIDLQNRPPMIRIESHKTARNRKEQHRFVEIHPAIFDDLVRLVSGRQTEDLLIPPGPDHHNATNVLTRACKALGIRYRRLHGFRHFWISTLLSAGVPLSVVMVMAGHRNLSTTQGYLHLDPRQTGFIQKLTTVHESVHDL